MTHAVRAPVAALAVVLFTCGPAALPACSTDASTFRSSLGRPDNRDASASGGAAGGGATAGTGGSHSGTGGAGGSSGAGGSPAIDATVEDAEAGTGGTAGVDAGDSSAGGASPVDASAGGTSSRDAAALDGSADSADASGALDASDAARDSGSAALSTAPNLKIAFIGDTTSGDDFKSVLGVVKNGGAAALVVNGDMSYTDDPDGWWASLESVLGDTFPVFIARGNHDDFSWAGYLPKAAQHLGDAVRVPGAHDANYKTIFRGLVIATIRLGDTGANLAPFLEDDPHLFKLCQWHQNQQAMQVGGKTDEMGWEVYETCRSLGAIVTTAHEHSYERTRTLTSTMLQIVDPGCPGATELCVGPGRTFVSVTGLGGNSIRPQLRCLPTAFPYGCGEWAFIYTSNQAAAFGAQFITFNAGAPEKATGYFENVNGEVVDTFSITHVP